MRKGTLLTSFILDEITAQARYRKLLDEAAQRRLLKLAKTERPSFFDRFWLSASNQLITCGLQLKAQFREIRLFAFLEAQTGADARRDARPPESEP